jgi:hypothetical protein
MRTNERFSFVGAEREKEIECMGFIITVHEKAGSEK